MLYKIRKKYAHYIFSFLVISIGLWFLEFLYSLVIRDKILNPGVLFGPWCPIYGVGFLFSVLLVRQKDNRIYGFFKILVAVALVEYITSYIISDIFNTVIWEYSDYPFNINGRICLHLSLIFAVIGYIVIYRLEPILKKLYIRAGIKAEGITAILSVLFICDILVSFLLS